MKKLITIITGLIIGSSALMAQTGEIKGIIKDKETNETLPGATVYVGSGENMQGTATDIDGHYTIKPLNPGVYEVTVKMMGYATVKMGNVTVTSDNIVFVDVTVEPASIELTGVNIVTYTNPLIRKDEPGVLVIPLKEIENSVHLHNPIAILGTLPGVTPAPNGKDVYVRGSRPGSTQFITDRVKSMDGGMGVPGQSIGSMKVYTGGVPALYGDFSGGVIVVETKSYYDLSKRYR